MKTKMTRFGSKTNMNIRRIDNEGKDGVCKMMSFIERSSVYNENTGYVRRERKQLH
jgi:hypothetical protein